MTQQHVAHTLDIGRNQRIDKLIFYICPSRIIVCDKPQNKTPIIFQNV